MAKRVTLAEVAADAGVSAKTVSDVIHHRGRMRESTRERVEASMRRLGYRTNLAARTLRTGEARLIGLAVPNFAQPFNGAFADAVTAYAWSKGYRVSITTYHRLDQGMRELAADAYRFGVDGWIFLSDEPLEKGGECLRRNAPSVLTGDYLAHGAADAVTFPNVAAAETAVRYLFDRGALHIGFVGAPVGLLAANGDFDPKRLAKVMQSDEGNAPQRFRGYAQVLRERGREVSSRLVGVCERLDRADGEHAVLDMLARGARFDALFCANDAVALGALSALDASGLSVPDDVQLVGFDNIPDAEFSTPRLTTINPSTEQYARIAVDRLLARLHGDESAPEVYVTDFGLVVRNTTREG